MRATRDEDDFRAGLGQSRAESSADAACAYNRDTHEIPLTEQNLARAKTRGIVAPATMATLS
jgi:hypothetical protein